MPKRKFTIKEIKIIKGLINAGFKTYYIIEKFSTNERPVNRQDISGIKTGKNYADIISDFSIYNKSCGR